jgi:hypothetical protein
LTVTNLRRGTEQFGHVATQAAGDGCNGMGGEFLVPICNLC